MAAVPLQDQTFEKSIQESKGQEQQDQQEQDYMSVLQGIEVCWETVPLSVLWKEMCWTHVNWMTKSQTEWRCKWQGWRQDRNKGEAQKQAKSEQMQKLQAKPQKQAKLFTTRDQR